MAVSSLHHQQHHAFCNVSTLLRWFGHPQIYHENGARGFYRGCLTNLARTTPAAALTFTSFELIARNLKLMAKAVRETDVV